MRFTILTLGLLLALAACGIKPRTLDPPPGKTSTYPKTYPNPAYDAKP